MIYSRRGTMAAEKTKGLRKERRLGEADEGKRRRATPPSRPRINYQINYSKATRPLGGTIRNCFLDTFVGRSRRRDAPLINCSKLTGKHERDRIEPISRSCPRLRPAGKWHLSNFNKRDGLRDIRETAGCDRGRKREGS